MLSASPATLPPLTDHEREILRRMKRIDQGQGTWASVEEIGKAKYDDELPKSRSQTRVHLRRLREKGYILVAGVSVEGTIIYLQHDRQYDGNKVAARHNRRTVALGWSIDAAQRLITEGPRRDMPTVEHYRGLYIGARVQRAYAREIWTAGVDEMVRDYGPRFDGVGGATGKPATYKISLLMAICKRLSHERRLSAEQRQQEMLEQLQQAQAKAAERARVEAQQGEIAAALARGLTIGQAVERVADGERFTNALPRPEETAPAVPKPEPKAPEAQVSTPTIADAVRSLLAVRKIDTSERTQDFYAGKAQRIIQIIGTLPLSSIGHDDVLFYLRRRQELASKRWPVGRETLRKEATILKSALRLARKRGWSTADPDSYWPRLRDTSIPRKRYLKRADLPKLMRHLKRQYQRDWVLWAVFTGGCLKELKSLRFEDVDLSAGWLHVRGTKQQKRDRIIPLHKRLARWCEKDGRPRAGPILSKWTNIWRDLEQACDAAGLAKLSPNDLRRTFASWMKQKGSDSKLVADLMGHADSRMVDRVYGRLDSEQYRRAMSRM